MTCNGKVSEKQQAHIFWYAPLSPITRNKAHRKPWKGRKERKNYQHGLQETWLNVFSGAIYVPDSATSSLHTNSPCTFAPFWFQHQDPTSPPMLLPYNKTAEAQITCLSTVSRVRPVFLRERGRKISTKRLHSLLTVPSQHINLSDGKT